MSVYLSGAPSATASARRFGPTQAQDKRSPDVSRQVLPATAALINLVSFVGNKKQHVETHAKHQLTAMLRKRYLCHGSAIYREACVVRTICQSDPHKIHTSLVEVVLYSLSGQQFGELARRGLR